MEIHEFKGGYLPSKPDSNDYMLAHLLDMESFKVAMPSIFSLPDVLIRDQGKFGTCVGHGAAYLKVYQELKNSPGTNLDFSPLFIYEECKKIDGNLEEGTYPRVAMQVLQKLGATLESSLPYSNLKNVKILPTPNKDMYKEAEEFKISTYASAKSINEIKAGIFTGSPVVSGVMVYENFIKPINGMIGLPYGNYLGGHCITFIGWDDNKTLKDPNTGIIHKGFMKFINSWTDKWGDKGYGWLAYDFITGHDLDFPIYYMQEAWTSVDVIMPSRKPAAPKTLIEMWLGKKDVLVNGQKSILPIAPKSENGNTLIPIRFVAENLGCQVAFDTSTNKITIKQF